MKKENQVSNLELSRKLKDLGVKQESSWYWIVPGIPGLEPYLADHKKRTTGETFSAFTVAELGEMLPDGKLTEKEEGIYYVLRGNEAPIKADTEANTRAKMKVYLLEKNIPPK